MVPGGAPVYPVRGRPQRNPDCLHAAGAVDHHQPVLLARVARIRALSALLSTHRGGDDAAARLGQPDQDLRGIVVGQPGTPDFARPQSLGLTLAHDRRHASPWRGFQGHGWRGLPCCWVSSSARVAAGHRRHARATHALERVHSLRMPCCCRSACRVSIVLAALPHADFLRRSRWPKQPRKRSPSAKSLRQVHRLCAVTCPAPFAATRVASLLGSLLGTSLIITSAENIGVVQTTGVRSRYVTATAGRC